MAAYDRRIMSVETPASLLVGVVVTFLMKEGLDAAFIVRTTLARRVSLSAGLLISPFSGSSSSAKK